MKGELTHVKSDNGDFVKWEDVEKIIKSLKI